MKYVYSFVASLLVALVAVVSMAVPAGASVNGGDLKVVNVGSRPMRTCIVWFGSRPTSNTNCYGVSLASGSCYLKKNEDTSFKCAIRDTNGVRVDAGYALKQKVIGPNPTLYGCREKTFWAEVGPSLFQHTKRLYLAKCSKYS